MATQEPILEPAATASTSLVVTPDAIASNDGATSPTADAKAAQAAQRVAQRQRRQGHATDGASAHYYAVPAGREALPIAPAPEREKICSFIPLTAAQISRMRRYVRTVEPQDIVLEDGTAISLKYKPSTHEDALALAVSTELLKSSLRVPYGEQLFKYIIAPSGLKAETHQFTRQLLNNLGPTNLMAWAKESDLPVYQALAHEVDDAWHDPKDLHLTCCEEEVPDKPNATKVKSYIQALGERAALWPEALRPLLGDLAKPMQYCQPSKLHEYLVYLQPMLQLSSRDLYRELLSVGQNLPPFLSFVALITPQTWAQSGSDAHKFLQSTLIKPKAKKSNKKRSTKRAAADAAAMRTPVNMLPESSVIAEPEETMLVAPAEVTEPEATALAEPVNLELEAFMDLADLPAADPSTEALVAAATAQDANEPAQDAADSSTEVAAKEAAGSNEPAAEPDAAKAEPSADADHDATGAAEADAAVSEDASTDASAAVTPERLAELRGAALASVDQALSAAQSERVQREAQAQERLHKQRKYQRKLQRQQRKQTRRHHK